MGAVTGVWGRSPQPPETFGGQGRGSSQPTETGGLGAKPRAAEGTRVWGWSLHPYKIFHFLAKIA